MPAKNPSTPSSEIQTPSRRRKNPPKYRLPKTSGQSIVTLDSKMFYLGKYGTAESRIRYERLIS
jgi:hypothetical protein